METICSKFTVYFDDPFWVGLIERRTSAGLEVARHVFGAEPSEGEIAEFVLNSWQRLCFSPPQDDSGKAKALNPKRMRRLIQRQSEQSACGTKAQQALQALREQQKQNAQARSRQQRDEEKELRFQQRQAKRKEKHKGH